MRKQTPQPQIAVITIYRMRAILFAAGMAITLVVYGDDQTSFQEAAARLQAKRVAATTQSNLSPEQREIASLKQMVRALAAENAELKKQLADSKNPKPAAVAGNAPKIDPIHPEQSIQIGMIFADVEKIRLTNPTLKSTKVSESATDKVIQWSVWSGPLSNLHYETLCSITFDKTTDKVTQIDIARRWSALSMADNYRIAGKNKLAKKNYQEVIDQYPGTAQAAAAKQSVDAPKD